MRTKRTYAKKRRARKSYLGLRGKSLTNYKNNLSSLIKEIAAEDVEKKQFTQTFNNDSYNAEDIVALNLTDVAAGTTNNSRIGNEIMGSHFDVLLNVFNKTNNDLFVRVALIALEGRGGTSDITSDSGLYQNPDGDVKTFTEAITEASNAAVMYPWDTKGSCKVLRERVLRVSKNNGGDSGSSRTIKWKIPYKKLIRFINPTDQGALKQSKRASLVVTAWSPNGGSQTTYTYTLDGICKFYFKDS